MTSMDVGDIQGIILRGYGKFDISRFLLLQVTDADAAKRWLGEIAPAVQTSAPGTDYDLKDPPPPVFNLSFTYPGLKALGLKDANMKGFTNEFREGMVTPHRTRLLGDFGNSEPANWRWGGAIAPMVSNRGNFGHLPTLGGPESAF